MNEMRKLMEAVTKVNEAFGDDPDTYSAERSVRQVTNKVHEAMDEQVLDPRSVADAALTYMSESDVADMARINEFFYDDEGDFEESVEVVGEAYDDAIEMSPVNIGSGKELLRDLQILERNTARVFAEAQQSQGRPDYSEMLLNELSMTLTEISDLVEKYEDVFFNGQD